MVRILSNGDIVPDDDPRARQSGSQKKPSSSSGNGQSGASSSRQQAESAPNPYLGQAAGGASLFTAANERLLAFGIPRIPLGSVVVEPLVAVAALLALVFFGWPGLLVVGFVYLVTQLSRDDSPVGAALSRFVGGPGGRNPPPPPPPAGDKRGKPFGGAGHKLGSQ